MNLRFILLATAAASLPCLAAAQPIEGLYIGAGALANLKQDEHLRTSPDSGLTGPSPRFRFDAGGLGGLGSVGYGLGNGLRAEVEGNYRQSSLLGVYGTTNPNQGGGTTQEDYGALVNVLYDVDLRPFGVPFLQPYVGLGAGYEWSHIQGLTTTDAVTGQVNHFGGTNGNFAYQGIAGVAFPVEPIPGLAFTIDYHFLGVLGNQKFKAQNFNGGLSAESAQISENLNHSLVVGVRFAFNTPAPVPPPPPAAPSPVVAPSRTYLVFFDWDRADLTDRARQIVAEAAQASTRVQATRIEVQGNADLSGTKQYNQKLSLRRAQTVAAELVRDGVPAKEIQIQAFGDTRPLVQTAPGVREPQNRRVAIILQ